MEDVLADIASVFSEQQKQSRRARSLYLHGEVFTGDIYGPVFVQGEDYPFRGKTIFSEGIMG